MRKKSKKYENKTKRYIRSQIYKKKQNCDEKKEKEDFTKVVD